MVTLPKPKKPIFNLHSNTVRQITEPVLSLGKLTQRCSRLVT